MRGGYGPAAADIHMYMKNGLARRGQWINGPDCMDIHLYKEETPNRVCTHLYPLAVRFSLG